jgi:methyl-accepting chemotaxis protein
VGGLIEEIALASNEQAQGADQVNTAAAQMDKATQANAASAEKLAASSEQLSAQADALKNIVEDMLALVAGADAGAGLDCGPARDFRPAGKPQRRRISFHAEAKPSAGGGGRKAPKPGEAVQPDADFSYF